MAKRKRRINCQYCDSYFYNPDDFVAHLEKEHLASIPENMTPWQFSYYLRTGKTEGKCIMCKKPTKWNETTHKYHRFCDNPQCKEKYVEVFRKRMIGKYGKVNLLNDPEQQKLMLSHRKISGKYLWSDHVHESDYTGSYEKSFLEFIDHIMRFDPEDVFAPSPHTYYYMYNNKKHFYIPDFYIGSLNLEIEIKDGGDNPNNHHKIQEIDKVKERLKDEVMSSNRSTFNYLKVINKNNSIMFRYLEKAKNNMIDGVKDKIVMLK